MTGSDGLAWEAADILTKERLNQKNVFVGTGAQINALTTYAGQLAYCTSTGSGFTVDIIYVRNAANSAWNAFGSLSTANIWTSLQTLTGKIAYATNNKGDILANDGTDYEIVAVGANDTVLTADSAQTSGVKWAAALAGSPVKHPRFSTVFEDISARFTVTNTAGGTTVVNTYGILLSTGASTGGRTVIAVDGGTLFYTTGYNWTDNFSISFMMQGYNLGSDYTLYSGFGAVTPAATTISMTVKQLGITNKQVASGGKNQSATNANGTTETSTVIGTGALSMFHYYTIISTSTSIKYYQDNVLVATHTTNLPTGVINSQTMSHCITNNNVAVASSYVVSNYEVEWWNQ